MAEIRFMNLFFYHCCFSFWLCYEKKSQNNSLWHLYTKYILTWGQSISVLFLFFFHILIEMPVCAALGCHKRRQPAVMCPDLSCRDRDRDGDGDGGRDRTDLTVSVSELAIITIRSVVVSGSCSVQAAPCLTCLWCGKSLLGRRAKRWGLGSLTVSCLPWISARH